MDDPAPETIRAARALSILPHAGGLTTFTATPSPLYVTTKSLSMA
jgi:hypothetical protein